MALVAFAADGSNAGQRDAALKERACTAVHEAAHLAMAELFPCRALEVHAVSIADSGPFAGGLIADAPDVLRRSELRALTAVLLAGFEAEWLFLGRPAFEHATTDLKQAFVLCHALAQDAGCTTEAIWRDLQGRVRGLLLRHWAAVEHLAVALVRRTVVPGDEARAIVRSQVPGHARYHDGRPLPPPLGHMHRVRSRPPPPPGVCRHVLRSDSTKR